MKTLRRYESLEVTFNKIIKVDFQKIVVLYFFKGIFGLLPINIELSGKWGKTSWDKAKIWIRNKFVHAFKLHSAALMTDRRHSKTISLSLYTSSTKIQHTSSCIFIVVTLSHINTLRVINPPPPYIITFQFATYYTALIIQGRSHYR